MLLFNGDPRMCSEYASICHMIPVCKFLIHHGFRSQHLDIASKATTMDTIKFMLSKHAYEFRQALISPCPMTQICDAFSERILAFCS